MFEKKEILSFEVYKNKDYYTLSIPVNQLKNPKFELENNCLFIKIENLKEIYYINNLQSDLVEAILNNKCYLLENLTKDKKYLINLVKK